MRLWKAYHHGMPGLRGAKARAVLFIFTAAGLFLAPAAGDARPGEFGMRATSQQAAAARPNAAQNQPARNQPAQNQPAKAVSTPGNKADPAQAGKQTGIHAQMAKLLQLANELQSDVDRTNKDTLSLSVVRKADAIEKLVRTMKNERPIDSSRGR